MPHRGTSGRRGQARRAVAILVGVGVLTLTALPVHGLAAAPAGTDAPSAPAPAAEARPIRAGAFAIDITPLAFPVIVNGGFLEKTATKAHDPLHARCLVLDDGQTRLAIAVVDNCVMPRSLLDEAKALAAKATGIPPERMLISATHTHSAPSVRPSLGCRADEAYSRYLPGRIAEGIERAAANLRPARVGWAVAVDREHTHCRRWIYRPDKMLTDPFGVQSVRAMMHPGHQNPACVGPAGPVDPAITMLSVQGTDGRPIAILANYSMHYYGASPLSADYYGHFCRAMARRLGADTGDPPFVAMMSQGTSGDLQWRDYGGPKTSPGIERYAEEVAAVAHEALEGIAYHERAVLAMAERTLTLGRRWPDAERLAWARKIADAMGDRRPTTKPEIYALGTLALAEAGPAELKLQAIRVGDLGITAVPCEVFGITGLWLKARSPTDVTMNMSQANGSEGYIPPPAQHALGGYTTWSRINCGLEVEAEPKIVDTVLGLLEQVTGRPRRPVTVRHGPYARAVLALGPRAYWRMEEFAGPAAADASDSQTSGTYEPGIAFHLEGPDSPAFSGDGVVNRAVHVAGGRLAARLSGLGDTYSVALWLWNGLPNDARAVTGYVFSRGPDGAKGAPGDHLGITGTHRKDAEPGVLLFFNGDREKQALAGRTQLHMQTWTHVVLVREGPRVRVHLNGAAEPEVAGEAAPAPAGCDQVFVGGRSDRLFGLEGKVDEAALFDRALSVEEIGRLWQAAALGGG